MLPYIGEDLPGGDNVADLSDVRNATNPTRTRTFGFERAEAFAEFKRPSYHIPSVDFKFFSASSAPTASTSVLQSSAGDGGSASLAQIEVVPCEMGRLRLVETFEQVKASFNQIGYAEVEIDGAGYRRGSLNPAGVMK